MDKIICRIPREKFGYIEIHKDIENVDNKTIEQYCNVIKKYKLEEENPILKSDSLDTERKCPKCGGNLTFKEGTSKAGKPYAFWGCSSFPDCKYTC